MLDWKTHADTNSLYNTPPCFTIYVCGLVFKKLLREGGLVAQQQRNKDKAALLYDVIDGSEGFYHCPVDRSARSAMNVPFTIPSSSDLEKVSLQRSDCFPHCKSCDVACAIDCLR